MAKDRAQPLEADEQLAGVPVQTITICWTPAPGNMTSTRIIDDYTWTPSTAISVDLAWWNNMELALRTSPRETFEPVELGSQEESHG